MQSVHPEIDRFASLDSPIHRWDARWKIVGFTTLILAFGLVGSGAGGRPNLHGDLPPALIALAVSIALVEISGIPIRFALRSLRPACFFFAFLFLVLPLTQSDGVPLAGPLSFSTTGLLLAGVVSIQAFSILLLVFPMFGTSRFEETTGALRSLRLPGPLVQLIVFSYRYLFVFADEVRRIQIAWRVRGFRRGLNLHTLKTVGNGTGMLLVGSVKRSERIYRAMVCRGYPGALAEPAKKVTRPRDAVKTGLLVSIAVGFAIWRVW